LQPLQDRPQFAQRHRAAEQVALQVVAAVGFEEFQLFDGFYALADHLQVQGVGHDDDGLDDLAVFLAAWHILQEGSVDLQDVQRQAFEVGQRRVTGTEVIDRQGHALGAHALEQADSALDVPHQCVFGDFQLQVAGRQS